MRSILWIPRSDLPVGLWSTVNSCCVYKVCCPLQGCEALICMPVTTPQIKVDAVRRLGGTVQLVGESYTETQSHAWVRATAANVDTLLCCCTP